MVCWDPPGNVIASTGLRTPAARCLTGYGKEACGYSCVAYDGEVRCSQTPGGFCRAQQGATLCWDPPLDSLPGLFEPGSEMERGITEGWPRVLSSMKSFLETGKALDTWAGKR